LAAQYGHASQALGIARARYRDGVMDFLNVLNTERTSLAAELELAQSTTKVALDQVQLFKALGGGWEGHFRRRSKRRPIRTVRPKSCRHCEELSDEVIHAAVRGKMDCSLRSQ